MCIICIKHTDRNRYKSINAVHYILCYSLGELRALFICVHQNFMSVSPVEVAILEQNP